jgi:hypothetical protein
MKPTTAAGALCFPPNRHRPLQRVADAASRPAVADAEADAPDGGVKGVEIGGFCGVVADDNNLMATRGETGADLGEHPLRTAAGEAERLDDEDELHRPGSASRARIGPPPAAAGPASQVEPRFIRR